MGATAYINPQVSYRTPNWQSQIRQQSGTFFELKPTSAKEAPLRPLGCSAPFAAFCTSTLTSRTSVSAAGSIIHPTNYHCNPKYGFSRTPCILHNVGDVDGIPKALFNTLDPLQARTGLARIFRQHMPSFPSARRPLRDTRMQW